MRHAREAIKLVPRKNAKIGDEGKCVRDSVVCCVDGSGHAADAARGGSALSRLHASPRRRETLAPAGRRAR